MAKTLTPAQCTALRTGTGRPNTLASLVRLELMDDTHTLTRAGRNIRATLDNGAPTLEHVAYVVREISRVNWNAPHTFWINEAGARTIAEGVPLFHNGHAVSVVWHPATEDAYVYAGTAVIAFRHGVQDLHAVDAAEWARTSVASATPAAPIMADWEREVMATGTVAPERPAAPVETPAAPVAPFTEWQRRERFETMRTAQRRAAGLREEAEYMATFPREYDAAEVTSARTDAGQWEHLATWLGDSVRNTPAAKRPAVRLTSRQRKSETVIDGTVRRVVLHEYDNGTRVRMTLDAYADGHRRAALSYFDASGKLASRRSITWDTVTDAPADNGHTLEAYGMTERRGMYYLCDACGSIGARESFRTFPCDTDA